MIQNLLREHRKFLGKNMVVYKITNLINSKVYIGCTINYEKRIREHKSCKFKGSTLLPKAFLKYGIDSFTFEILQHYKDESSMFSGEIEYIQKFKSIDPSGYNLHYGGKGGSIQLTEDQLEQRKLLAKSLSSINTGNKYNLGRKASDETRLKLSKINKNKVLSEETKQKMSKSKIGNSYSKGVAKTDEHREKISKALKGKKFSEEHKKNMSIAAKRRVENAKRNKHGQFESAPMEQKTT